MSLLRPQHPFQPRLSLVTVRRFAWGDTNGMTTTRVRIRDDFPAAPVCPHCGKDIQEPAARRV